MRIKFKSTPENWKKEYLGLKCNTVRIFEDNTKDYRLEILEGYISDLYNILDIEIENKKTGDVFVRRITDITKWNKQYIISWKHEFKKRE